MKTVRLALVLGTIGATILGIAHETGRTFQTSPSAADAEFRQPDVLPAGDHVERALKDGPPPTPPVVTATLTGVNSAAAHDRLKVIEADGSVSEMLLPKAAVVPREPESPTAGRLAAMVIAITAGILLALNGSRFGVAGRPAPPSLNAA